MERPFPQTVYPLRGDCIVTNNLAPIVSGRHSYLRVQYAAVILLSVWGTSIAQTNIPDWPDFNRRIGISIGQSRQHYRELDSRGLTSDGTLDQEAGNLTSGVLELRWQGRPWENERIQSYIAVKGQRNKGTTQYQGYLQGGNGQLTPYSADTGNIEWQGQLRIGLALPQRDAWQVVPYLELAYRRWERQLDQYNEKYTHKVVLAGLLGQWCFGRQWTFEFGAAYGGTIQADMRLNAPSFDQSLAKASIWQAEAQLNYHLTPRFSLNGAMNHAQWRYGQSAQQNNLQEPESLTRQTRYSLGLTWHY